MSDQISESLSVEKIMERIRERVRLRKQAGDSAGVTSPTSSAAPSQEVPPLALYNLAELRHNIAANSMLWNQVGTINPRPPGWHNDLIQQVKKGIRRLLTWYTRPLHQFSGSVTRSLNETTRAVEDLQKNLGVIGQRLEALQQQVAEAQTTQQAALAPLSERLGQLEQTTPAQLQALQNQLGGLETSQKSLFAAVGERLNRLDEAQQAALAPLSERLGQLEQTTPAQLQALQAHLQEALTAEREQAAQRLEAQQQHLTEALTAQQAAVAACSEREGQLEQSIPAQLEALQAHLQEALTAEREQAAQRLEAQQNELAQLRGQAETVADQVRKFQSNRIFERLRLSERNVRRLVHLLEERGQPTLFAPQAQLLAVPPPETQMESDFDYFWFEERFRGDEAQIKERQRIYVDYFSGRQNVLDLGCGRGEFLELLRENGTPARGVEINTDMVLLCREKGLDVVQEDLFSYLESIPDESVSGIFSAQVIEHLTTPQLLRLIGLAKRKLAQGSPLILETINPQCLYVFSASFYADITHIRPVHPATLQFLAESAGFHHVETKFTSPVNGNEHISLPHTGPEAQDALTAVATSINRINELLFGDQEYAVIGFK